MYVNDRKRYFRRIARVSVAASTCLNRVEGTRSGVGNGGLRWSDEPSEWQSFIHRIARDARGRGRRQIAPRAIGDACDRDSSLSRPSTRVSRYKPWMYIPGNRAAAEEHRLGSRSQRSVVGATVGRRQTCLRCAVVRADRCPSDIESPRARDASCGRFSLYCYGTPRRLFWQLPNDLLVPGSIIALHSTVHNRFVRMTNEWHLDASG